MNTQIFLAAFMTLLLAELGDKTQLAVITLASSSKSPWSVFFGALAALTVVTALGTLLGASAARLLPETLIHRGAGLVFIGVGFWMWVNH